MKSLNDSVKGVVMMGVISGALGMIVGDLRVDRAGLENVHHSH